MKKGRELIMLRLSLFLALVLGFIGVSACEGVETPEEIDFDRSTLLESLATELIIPNFESLQASVNDLSNSTEAFNENPSAANLSTLRGDWEKVAIDFQHTSAFGFGPADLPLGAFATVLGVFPINEQGIEENLNNPDFNLASSFQRDIRGLYGIEYLIYGNELSDTELIAGFNEDRKAYLMLLINELKTNIDRIVESWNGAYFQEFISDNSTSAGSSISLLYNAFIKDYENLKNFKIELPAGLTAGTSVDPTLVEAYYSGISRDLVIAHFENSANIWFGRNRNGQNLIGFQEYLGAIVGGQDLVDLTLPVINNIETALADLPQGRLSDHLESANIITLRDLLQSNTANFKSSMSSLLGISITFNSGDGD